MGSNITSMDSNIGGRANDRLAPLAARLHPKHSAAPERRNVCGFDKLDRKYDQFGHTLSGAAADIRVIKNAVSGRRSRESARKARSTRNTPC